MYTTASKKCKKLNSLLHFIYLFIFFQVYMSMSLLDIYNTYLQPMHIEKKYAHILRIFKRNNFVNLRNFSFTFLHQIPFQNSAS